jgi:NADPH-dependent glutamate synthase beta subunit-like oxidoreductase
MDPTATHGTEYFHRVVDCQWACPAHTDVPEYIRLIAQNRFDDAYLLNRQSNVFPGILGRVCDRPCEPACRRGRVEEKPVAICRLKRAAADRRGDIEARLPRAPRQKNDRRIALIGAGCASLTVANDLAPLGYECVIFEALDRAGGLMRTNIPAFRLPAEVLDEEIGYITRMGVDLRLSCLCVVCERCSRTASPRCSSAAVRRKARTCACRGARPATVFTSASIGSARSPSGTPRRLVSAC